MNNVNINKEDQIHKELNVFQFLEILELKDNNYNYDDDEEEELNKEAPFSILNAPKCKFKPIPIKFYEKHFINDHQYK